MLRGVGDHDGRGRGRTVSGVRRSADIVEQTVDCCGFAARRGVGGQASVTTGTGVGRTAQRGEVGRRDQYRAFVPDGTDTQATVTAIQSSVAAGSRTATAAAAGTDVTGNRAGADDGQGGAAGVVDTASRSAALATGTIPAGTTPAAADRQGARARCATRGAVGITPETGRAGATDARTAATAHGVGAPACPPKVG